ncbi:MAG: hypothetical protein ACYCYO_20760 [Bacilli bacterium]
MIPWFLNPNRSDDDKVLSILAYYYAGTLEQVLEWRQEVKTA